MQSKAPMVAAVMADSRWYSLSNQQQLAYSIAAHVLVFSLLAFAPKCVRYKKVEAAPTLVLELSTSETSAKNRLSSPPAKEIATVEPASAAIKTRRQPPIVKLPENLPRAVQVVSLNKPLPQGEYLPPTISAVSSVPGPPVPTPVLESLDPLIREELESEFVASLPAPSAPQLQSENAGPTKTPKSETSISESYTQDIEDDAKPTATSIIVADFDGHVEVVRNERSTSASQSQTFQFAKQITTERPQRSLTWLAIENGAVRSAGSSSTDVSYQPGSFNEFYWWEWVLNRAAQEASRPSMFYFAKGKKVDWVLPGDISGMQLSEGTVIESRLHYSANDTQLNDVWFKD